MNTKFAINDPTKSKYGTPEFHSAATLTMAVVTHAFTSFFLSKRTVDYLPDKPNHVMPKIKLHDGDVDFATTKLRSVCSKKDVHLGPSEKYPLPKTTSEEYGWIHKALVQPNRMFAHKLNSCDITRYANAYYSMSGTTPFSRKKELN